MTIPPDEHGDLLRRVMRAEADSVVPSPDGLEIIRHRIDNRGLRGLLWWRIGASVAAAALVAGIVVVTVPEIRENVGVDFVGNEPETEQTPAGELPSAGSTAQPPPTQDQPGISITTQNPTRAPESTAPATSAAPSQPAAAPPPEPSSDPCVTPEPTPAPDPAVAAKCPTQEANPTSGPTTKPNPSGTKSPTKPSPTPTADSPTPTPPGCGDDCPAPTPEPSPLVTPSTVEVSTPAS
uniref:hypothetical protein n=1 Tax=Herbidospora sakaeratensis TaxID=564415 RepID=UPI0007838EA1|nr:hypothetical protein [Herbidospora sakaeratensis]